MKRSSLSNFHIALNRDGVLFAFFCIALCAATLYSAKNALILFTCCTLSALAALLSFARRSFFQKITIQRRFQNEIFAKKETSVELQIQNHGKYPIFGLHIFERFDDGKTIGPIFIPRLNPNEIATANYACEFPNRGIAHFCGFQIRSRFPLPFLEARANIHAPQSIPIFPQPIPQMHWITFKELYASEQKESILENDTALQELVHGRKMGRILYKLSAKRQVWIEQRTRRQKQFPPKTGIQLLDTTQIDPSVYELQISQITAFILQQLDQGCHGSIQIGKHTYNYAPNPQSRHKILETLAFAPA